MKKPETDKYLLTDKEFLQRLEMLNLLARKVLGGNLKADRKSTKKGSGILFADHAEYNLGDDYRSIDWNIYARMESLVVKLFEVEEDTSVFILLDISRSMRSKAIYAKKLAAALGYIALSNSDKLAVYGFGEGLHPILNMSHGKGKIFPMLHSLGLQETEETDTRFSECMKTFYSRHKRPGVCIVISDFFIKNGYSEGLKFLQWSKNDIFCMQVLDPAELVCDWKGDVEIECIETAQRQNITVRKSDAEHYAEVVKEWNETLKRECILREAGYCSTTIETPFEDIIQYILRRGGLVS